MIGEKSGLAKIALVVALWIFSSGELAGGAGANLFSDYTGADVQLPSNPTVIRSRLVSVNFDQLFDSATGAAMSPSLALNLFDDVFLTAVLDRAEHNPSGSDIWIGHLEGNPFSQVTLVINGKILIGNVSSFKSLYTIRYSSSGAQVIREIDQSKFPPD